MNIIGKEFYWVNLREEPLIYVNGKPYALRNIHTPFDNIEYTGITRYYKTYIH